MYLIMSFQLLFGIVFVHRTIQTLRQRKLITEADGKMLRVLLFMMFFCVTALTQHDPRVQMTAILCCGSLLLTLPSFFKWRLKSRIQSEFPSFMNKIILEMKSGFSFRGAIERQLHLPIEIWEQWLRSMIESRVFLHQIGGETEAWWTPYLQELQAAEQNPHQALTRLENFREKLRVMSEFRRKSGQATAQARIQMVVMTVLYIALLILTTSQMPIRAHHRTIVLSLSLFVVGQIAFWWAGRKRNWKI
jgi:Flp pilus assembly protein TadB